MAKRKPEPTNAAQMDMFGEMVVPSTVPVSEPIANAPSLLAPKPANDRQTVQAAIAQVKAEPTLAPTSNKTGVEITTEAVSEVATPYKAPRQSANITSSITWIDDEWWTLAMVCTYLKLGRKAVWERKRDPKIGFPQPICLGSTRPRWRGEDVRAWAGAQS